MNPQRAALHTLHERFLAVRSLLSSRSPLVIVRAAYRMSLRVMLRLIYRKRTAPILAWLDQPLVQDGYEHHVLRAVDGLRGELALDVGASTGQYTLWLARNFRRVVAVEPHPLSVRILRNRLERLRVRNVEVVEAAVADVENPSAELHLSWGNPHGSSIVRMKDGGRIRVVSLTLDSLLSREETVDLAKVDVEGAEWLVLEGAAGSMRKVRRWLIELHNVDRKAELDRVLKGYGYRTFWIEKGAGYPHVLAVREGRSVSV